MYAYWKPDDSEIYSKILEAYLLEAHQKENGEWIAELEINQYPEYVRRQLVRARPLDLCYCLHIPYACFRGSTAYLITLICKAFNDLSSLNTEGE